MWQSKFTASHVNALLRRRRSSCPHAFAAHRYLGLIWSMYGAILKKARDPDVYGDSALILRQMKGENAVNDRRLKILHAVASGLKGQLGDVVFHEIPRDLNQRADGLAFQAVRQDGYPKGSFAAYYPNLMGYSMATLDEVKVVATNDIMSSCTDGLFFIDAAFLQLVRPNALCNLKPAFVKQPGGSARPMSVLTIRSGPLNILGMLSGTVRLSIDYCPYLPRAEGPISSQARTIDVTNLIVVLDLPVPLHVSVRHPNARDPPSILSGRHALKCNLDKFPPQYRAHPFHATDAVMLPY